MTLDANRNSRTTTKTLPIVGYYSTSGALELRGSSQGLVELADIVRAEESISEALLTVNQGLTADPYDHLLSSIRVCKSDGPVIVARDGSSLEISGSLEALKPLAENIELLAKEKSETSSHIHIEYYPGHFFLSPSSAPLVVERDPSAVQ
jgi:hypothetical protein